MKILNEKKLKSKNKKNDPYIIITYHPVKNLKDDYRVIQNIFRLVKKFKNFKYYFTSSNSDTNGLKLNMMIESFCKKNNHAKNFKSLGHAKFLKLASTSKMLLGNSSSSIIEGSTLSLPAVNIGERQKNRTSSNNIVNSSTDYKSIERAFLNALELKKDKIKNIFYKKNTSYNISHKINKILNLPKKSKKFYEIN